MEVFEAIRGRRSIRSYLDKAVEREKIEQVIEAGLWAPTGQNLQPCRFIVVTGRALIDEIEAEIYGIGRIFKRIRPFIALFGQEMRGEGGRRVFRSLKEKGLYKAPVIIMVGAMRKSSATYLKDCSLATQNMMLAAHALGLGSCYIGWMRLLNYSLKMKRRLNVPKGFNICDAIILGYPASAPAPPKRKTLAETVTWF
jgi:nitroreductase